MSAPNSADLPARLATAAAHAIAESNGLAGPNTAEIAAGKAAVAQILRTLGAMTEEEVIAAAADEFLRAARTVPMGEGTADMQRMVGLHAASALLGARQTAEIQRLREELQRMTVCECGGPLSHPCCKVCDNDD